MLCQGGRAQQEAKKEEVMNVKVHTTSGLTMMHTDVEATMDHLEMSMLTKETISFMNSNGKQQMYFCRHIVLVEEL